MKRIITRQYIIYFTWNDGEEDSIIEYSAKDRDSEIAKMLSRGDFSAISWAYMYADGEVGELHKVL